MSFRSRFPRVKTGQRFFSILLNITLIGLISAGALFPYFFNRVAHAAISLIDTFEFDDRMVRDPDVVQVSASIYAIAYQNSIAPGVGGYLKTVSIPSSGDIGSVLDTLTFESPSARTPDIISVGGGVFAIAYHNQNTNEGKIVKVPITPSGDIGSVSASWIFESTHGKTPSITPVAGNIYAIAYSGYSGSADGGVVKTINLDTGAILDTFIFDSSKGVTPKIIPISGSIYAIAYEGPPDDGFIKTIFITPSGDIGSSIIDTLEFDPSKGLTPRVISVGTGIYAIAYEGSGNDGTIKTVSISSMGDIGSSAIDTLVFDASNGETPSIASIGGGTYAIAYEGPGSDGFVKTISITPSGDIGAVLDTSEFDPVQGVAPFIFYISSTVSGIAYQGPADDGFLKTLDIGILPPPTVDIKANGSDGPITIPFNGSVTISWTSSEATSCSVSLCPPGPPTTGSCTDLNNSGRGTGNLTSSQTYTLSCSGPGGSASDSVTVNVPSPSPTNHGMIAYDQDGATAPRYRLWDGSDLGSELNGIPKEGGHGEDYFLDLEHSPVYNQKIFVEQTSNGHIRAMIWDGFTSTWSLGAGAPANGDFAAFSQASSASRAYGVAYEGLSGQALLVYENSASPDRSFGYAVWNGASWSGGTYNYEAGGCMPASGFFIDDRVQWMKAKGQVNGNDILVWFSTSNTPGQKDGYALIWKGDTNTFANCKDMTDNTGLIATTPAENFDIAWETTSKDAMVVWGQAQAYSYKTFSGGVWSSTGIVVDMANDVQSMELASDPTSNYIAFIGGDLQIPTNDMEVRMWNGSNWTSVAVPDQVGNGSSSIENVNTHRVAVAWESASDQALFAFTKNGNDYIDYFMYDRSDNRFFCPENGQTVTDLDNAEGSSGPCNTSNIQTWKQDVGAIRLAPDPLANTIFLMAVNDVSSPIQLEVLVWRGDVNGFSLPSTNVPEGDVSPGSFINPQAYPFDFAFNFGTLPPPIIPVDCGIRYLKGNGVINRVACEPVGTLTSALRVRKDGTTYGLILVPITDANASPMNIRTAGGIMALQKMIPPETTVATSLNAAGRWGHGAPTTVFLNNSVGYNFYSLAGNDCRFSKTTNGGSTWVQSVQPIDPLSECENPPVVWYDQWTPGDTSGRFIHIAFVNGDTSAMWYTRLDTTDDSLTSPVNVSVGQSPEITGGQWHAITKGTDGDLYVGIQTDLDSFVVKCTTSCAASSSSWSEVPNPFAPRVKEDHLILMPLPSANIMAIRWQKTADDIESRVYRDATNSWDPWVTIDANAPDNGTYRAAEFGVTLDKTTGNIYLAYAGDVDTLGGDDDVRTAFYNVSTSSWTSTANVLTNDAKGITGVKIARNDSAGRVYVVYTARINPSDASSANVYWKVSADNMSSWGAEQGPINETSDDLYGLRVNISSLGNVHASWHRASVATLFGASLDD